MIPHFAVPRTTVVYADSLYVCWHRLPHQCISAMPVRAPGLAITSPRREAQTSDLKRSGYQAIIQAGQSMPVLRTRPGSSQALALRVSCTHALNRLESGHADHPGPRHTGRRHEAASVSHSSIAMATTGPQATGVQFENKSQESRVKTALPVPASGNRDSRLAHLAFTDRPIIY